MKQLPHIGTIELVSLPDDRLQGVPAKVDTGADGSAIWASGIKHQKSQLLFNFFAPGSAYYRKQAVTTTEFKTISVKNSFGHKELRYKVKLTVKIGNYKFREWFSLADRSRNTYPILIGKNALKNRFVVDVSRRYLVSKEVDEHKVLVLDRSPQLTQDFFETVKQRGQLDLDYEVTDYDSLIYYLNAPETKIVNARSGTTDLSRYALTYFKTHTDFTEFAAAVAEYLQFKGRQFVDSEVAHYISDTKLTEYTKLACYGLPIPPTICARTALLRTRYSEIKRKLGTPFVLKEIASDNGRNNYLVSSRQDFLQILDEAPRTHTYLAQQYIPQTALIRVYVASKKAVLAVENRAAKPSTDKLHSHLHTFTLDEKTKLIPISKELSAIARQAAQCLGRQIAGVDMIKDKNSKKWYILEVNSAPQIRSGLFLEEKAAMMAHFFDEELRQ